MCPHKCLTELILTRHKTSSLKMFIKSYRNFCAQLKYCVKLNDLFLFKHVKRAVVECKYPANETWTLFLENKLNWVECHFCLLRFDYIIVCFNQCLWHVWMHKSTQFHLHFFHFGLNTPQRTKEINKNKIFCSNIYRALWFVELVSKPTDGIWK